MSGNTDIKISRDFVVYLPREQGAYPIQESDWNRLKRLISKLVPGRRLFEVLSSVSFGIFASSVLALIAFKATSGLPSWVLPTCWATLVASACLGVAFEILFRQQAEVSRSSVQTVLEEMAELEKNYIVPSAGGNVA